jgi:hypothetical protein
MINRIKDSKLVFEIITVAKEPDQKENENQARGIQDFAEIIDPLQHHYPTHHKFYICLSTTYWHIVDNRIFRTA